MILLALLACATGHADRDHYLLAASLPGLDEAVSECTRIEEASLRSECVSFAASRAGAEGHVDEALAACLALGLPGSQECAFLVADTAGLLGARAISACDATHALRFECLCHAADRQALAREDLPRTPGEEAALVTAIIASTRDYLPEERPAVVSQVSRGIAARVIATRWQGGRFHPGLCGAADPVLCTRAYRASLQPWLLEHDPAPLCRGGPPTRAQVEAAGLPGWEDEGAPLAHRVWQRVCAGP